MQKIAPIGDPACKVWFLIDYPTNHDKANLAILSGGLGYVFKKVITDSGLPSDSFVVPVVNVDDDTNFDRSQRISDLITAIEFHKPSFIVACGRDISGELCPSTKAKKKPFLTQLDKYAGSLLTSDKFSWEHYVIPSWEPMFLVQNWSYRDIMVSIDYGHVKEEYDYYLANNKIQPLVSRSLITEPTFDVLMEYLYLCKDSKMVSTDIETIRPPKNSQTLRHHCGYPYTNSFAISPYSAISYSLWDYPQPQLNKIWRLTDAILTEVPQIGQNFFSFDAHFFEALGFTVTLANVQDTLLRHHILWPELEHKLQFQTKQYTRQPYYKDEGKGWTVKQKKNLMHYNCLDTAVTLEVFLAQEQEFNERPYLR